MAEAFKTLKRNLKAKLKEIKESTDEFQKNEELGILHL